MEFRVLGPVEVYEGGLRLDLGGRKQRTVLALLVSNWGRPTSADKLIDGTYGDEPPAGARHSVQTYVSNLRGKLGDSISSAGHSYELQSDGSTVDFIEFERRVDAAGARLEGDFRGAANELRAALDLWRGAPFEDVEVRGELEMETARLNELRLAALETRIDADLACGRNAELVGELEALTAEHPFRERFHAQLMVALYRSGRQAAALRAYQGMRARLGEELGIEASPELRSLEQQILEQDPSLDLAPSDSKPESAPGLAVAVEPPRPLVAVDPEDSWVAPVLHLAARRIGGVELATKEASLRHLPARAAAGEWAPKRARRTWSRLAIGAGSVLFVLVVGAILIGSRDDPVETTNRSPAAVVTPTSVATPAAPAAVPGIKQTIYVGEGPELMLADDSAVWVTLVNEAAIARIDAETRKVTTFPVGENPTLPLDLDGRLWVPSRAGGLLAVVDKSSGETIEIQVGERLDTPIAAAGLIWVPAREDYKLFAIDPATLEIEDAIPLAGYPMTPVLADGGLWVVARESGDVTRVDPFTRSESEALLNVGRGAHPPILVGRELWIVNRNGGTVTFVDTLERRGSGTVNVEGELSKPVLVDGRVLLADTTAQNIAVIDVERHEELPRIPTGHSTGTPIAHGDNLWASDPDNGRVIWIEVATRAIKPIAVDGRPGAPLSAHGFVWVPDTTGNTITLLHEVAEQ